MVQVVLAGQVVEAAAVAEPQRLVLETPLLQAHLKVTMVALVVVADQTIPPVVVVVLVLLVETHQAELLLVMVVLEPHL
jgi:hypothetical protein